MRTDSATDYIGLRHFRHHGLDVPHSHRPNHRAAFIADDVGLVVVNSHDEATAAVGPQRHVRYDRHPVFDLLVDTHLLFRRRFDLLRLGDNDFWFSVVVLDLASDANLPVQIILFRGAKFGAILPENDRRKRVWLG